MTSLFIVTVLLFLVYHNRRISKLRDQIQGLRAAQLNQQDAIYEIRNVAYRTAANRPLPTTAEE